MRVEGEVYFSEIPDPFVGATVIIRVEDTSRADAAAELISERRLTGVSRSPDNPYFIPFVIDVPTTKAELSCSIRVHVDVNSTGEITSGDYVSTQSYQLKSNSSPIRLQVVVHAVR